MTVKFRRHCCTERIAHWFAPEFEIGFLSRRAIGSVAGGRETRSPERRRKRRAQTEPSPAEVGERTETETHNSSYGSYLGKNGRLVGTELLDGTGLLTYLPTYLPGARNSIHYAWEPNRTVNMSADKLVSKYSTLRNFLKKNIHTPNIWTNMQKFTHSNTHTQTHMQISLLYM